MGYNFEEFIAQCRKLVEEAEDTTSKIKEFKGASWEPVKKIELNPLDKTFDVYSMEMGVEELNKIADLFQIARSPTDFSKEYKSVSAYCDRFGGVVKDIIIQFYEDGTCKCCGAGAHTLKAAIRKSIDFKIFKEKLL